MRYVLLVSMAAVSVCLSAAVAHAECKETVCSESGRHGSECPTWAVCTTYTGECRSGKAPLSVCTGTCDGGATLRFVPDVRGLVTLEDEPIVGGMFGLELVPPLAGGHVSLRGAWWTNSTWEAGMPLSMPLGRNFLLGMTIDAVHRSGHWGASLGLRGEYFPEHLMPGFIPFQWLSTVLEIGATSFTPLDEGVTPEVTMGLRVWI